MRFLGRRQLIVAGIVGSIAAWFGSTRATARSFGDVGELREAVMAAARAAPGVTKVVADPDNAAQFTSTIDGETVTSDVTNLFAFLSSHPDDNPDEAIARFVRSMAESLGAAITDDIIVPVVRTRDYVEDADGGGKTIFHEPFGADLITVYMADRPDSMAAIGVKDLPNRSLEDIRKTALSNLRKSLAKLVEDDELGFGMLYYVDDNPMLSPSLLLLDEFWQSIAARFSGDVLIALPRKDQLFLFEDDPRHAAAARRLIELTIEENFNLLTPQLYARRKGKVVAVSE
ncbi:DUF1444 family protein [Rhizorhabdus sp.]|jgi:uncharacterized protein YtpQ (UPF0354 family)|uniref:DUF1444 family protein n=1 Tax=Rhizorhabdus sp. TaxID=1968843 RepID=UPI001B6DED4B|nr:DUF1444 family protein [Rhizorhabdus sp.]MBP8233675.1 DUF1444 family protein [Rhizorhabdus sp.]